MADKLTVGLDFILPPSVAGGEEAEVFEVFKIITQPALPAVERDGAVVQEATEAHTTVRLRGVHTEREIALGIAQLAELGWPVAARKES